MATLNLDGWGNGYAPEEKEETEVFQSEDLEECLYYGENYEDYRPLRFAIELQTERLRIAKKLIDELKDFSTGVIMKNKLQQIKNYL